MNKNTISYAVVIAILAVALIGCGRAGNTTNKTIGQSGMVCDFENIKPWDISPERGFSLSLSKEYVTQGKSSLKVVFPIQDQASINTKKLAHKWDEYKALEFDVYNSHNRRIDFTIRLDDDLKKRKNISYPLVPGWNHVKIEREKIAAGINPAYITRVVLFLNNPDERVTLYFDNMRLEGYASQAAGSRLQAAGSRVQDLGERQDGDKKVTMPPGHQVTNGENVKRQNDKKIVELIEGDKLKTAPRPAVQEIGEIRLAVAKLTEEKKSEIFVSTGMPFMPGKIFSDKDIAFFDESDNEMPIATKILARWPQDGSIRSVLVQSTITINKKYSYVVMKWGEARKSTNLNIKEVNWQIPEGIIVLPNRWLCDSLVAGAQVPMELDKVTGRPLNKYDQNVLDKFAAMKNANLTGDAREDDYYDTAHVFYQLYVRTGDDDYFKAARREAIRYRDTQIIQDGLDRGRAVKHAQSRYIYIEGMIDDYLLTGDEKSLTIAGYMAQYLAEHFSPDKAFIAKGDSRFWTEREQAFPFLGILTYYELTGDNKYFEIAKKFMANLYRTQMQWPQRGGFIHNLYSHDPEEGARRDEYGGSPFMTGLLLEAIVKYHQLTDSEIAKSSIFMALDWLAKECLVPEGDAFVYTTADSRKGEGHPDLNLLIVHAFGYGYKISGYARSDYLELGIKVFERGVKSAHLGNRKHFNQNYRSSGHFLAYIEKQQIADSR